jgi:hypothetical protein
MSFAANSCQRHGVTAVAIFNALNRQIAQILHSNFYLFKIVLNPLSLVHNIELHPWWIKSINQSPTPHHEGLIVGLRFY